MSARSVTAADPTQRLRVCVLWTRLSGYLAASFDALVEHEVDLLVVHELAAPSAPFDDALLTAGFRSIGWAGRPDRRVLEDALEEFDPDVLVVNSWHVGAYRQVSRQRRGRSVRIVTVHNWWTGTPKQLAARLIAPLLLHPTYDAAFVCDEHQAGFAERLGFPAERMLWGVNTCDQPLFAEVAIARGDRLPPDAFLFVGRLVADKAIDVLAEAYSRYRVEAAHPWPLLVAGVGPDAPLLAALDGVEMLGFVQPDELPQIMARAGCLVLPSRLEPWAVVVHEAVSAGLPVVCSRACGAASRLVLDGYNGIVVTPGSVDGLVTALHRIAGADDVERRSMGRASASLSQQYTPQRWAHTLVSFAERVRGEVIGPSTRPVRAQS